MHMSGRYPPNNSVPSNGVHFNIPPDHSPEQHPLVHSEIASHTSQSTRQVTPSQLFSDVTHMSNERLFEMGVHLSDPLVGYRPLQHPVSHSLLVEHAVQCSGFGGSPTHMSGRYPPNNSVSSSGVHFNIPPDHSLEQHPFMHSELASHASQLASPPGYTTKVGCPPPSSSSSSSSSLSATTTFSSLEEYEPDDPPPLARERDAQRCPQQRRCERDDRELPQHRRLPPMDRTVRILDLLRDDIFQIVPTTSTIVFVAVVAFRQEERLQYDGQVRTVIVWQDGTAAIVPTAAGRCRCRRKMSAMVGRERADIDVVVAVLPSLALLRATTTP
jgi:hypothetical protein